jgi:hypothetical protein
MTGGMVAILFMVAANSSHPLWDYENDDNVIQGSGYFFHDEMPGYRLPSLAAATVLDFTACRIQYPPSQKPTASFAYPGGNSQLIIRSTGAIILP